MKKLLNTQEALRMHSLIHANMGNLGVLKLK